MAPTNRTPRADRPRSNSEPAELRRKEALLDAPHVHPLTELVERLRADRGDDAVPWFDPTEAGVEATILALLPGPEREPGDAGFLSSDNDDPTAANIWEHLQEAGIDRATQYLGWNVVPWYLDRRTVNAQSIREARPALAELLGLLPKLEVIVLLGDDAQRAWDEIGVDTDAAVLRAPHPSPLSLNTDRSGSRKRRLRQTLVEARQIAEGKTPAVPQQPRRPRAYEPPPSSAPPVRHIEPAARITGHVAVPGDKSVSHRSLLIGAMSEGPTVVRGFGRGGDTESTIAAMRSLGAYVDDADDDRIVVHGADFRDAAIDCGNAGTLVRLIAGLLAGRGGTYVLTGDESLSARPMERIAEPLRRMGAVVETTEGHLPLHIRPAQLTGIDYELPVASAQVKSAVLLAGLGATGPTTVVEPTPTRDHTELMLEAAGIRVRRRPTSVTVEPGTPMIAEVTVPGDISSAAPLLVAAALLPGSDLTIHDVGLNPRRTGLLDVLERMGARVSIFNRRREGREPTGAVQVQFDELVSAEIHPREIPTLVDELPLVALLAAHARGKTRIRGAEELRLKESDRIEAVTDALRAIGARIKSTEDGWEITGVPARLRGGRIDSRGDHRIAMLGAVAGLASREGVELKGAETAAISFPGFYDLLDSVVQR